MTLAGVLLPSEVLFAAISPPLVISLVVPSLFHADLFASSWRAESTKALAFSRASSWRSSLLLESFLLPIFLQVSECFLAFAIGFSHGFFQHGLGSCRLVRLLPAPLLQPERFGLQSLPSCRPFSASVPTVSSPFEIEG